MGVYNSIQGNMGLGKAIEYFTSYGYTIAIPLNDTQKYDLIVDINNKLSRISVKTSRHLSENNTYEVNLRNCGGASGKNIVRHFDKNSCDYIFIYTGNNKIYLIPTEKIDAKNSIMVGKKYIEYEVHVKTLNEYHNELNNNK